MPNHKAVRDLAVALRKHSKRAVEYHTEPPPQYGIIRNTDPLTVELTDLSFVLQEDDVVLSQPVRVYDRDHGLEVGDALVLSLMGNGDWFAFGVSSDKDVGDG